MPLAFFVSFLSSTRKIYIFALNPNLIIIAPLFSSFIKPSTFFINGIPLRIIDRVITSVESINVTLHDLIHILALNIVNEIVQSTYITLHFMRYHILVMKFIQTYLGYVENAHTYADWSNFTSSLRIFIATKFSEKTLRLWKFGFAIIVSAVYLPAHQKSYVDVIAYILHDFIEESVH